MTSLKLAKDFTGNDIYCNHLNVDALTSGTLLDLTGNVTVQGNLAVTGNTSASGITARSPTTCTGSATASGSVQICSAGAGANTIAFFNGPGRVQVAAPPDVGPVAPAGPAVIAANDYVNHFNTIRGALQQYGLLG